MMRYAKAVIGALIAGLGTLATALSDDGIEAVEWVWVAIAFLTALGAVAAVPNRSTVTAGEHRADPDGHVRLIPPPLASDERLHPRGEGTWTATTGDMVGRADADARDRDPLA